MYLTDLEETQNVRWGNNRSVNGINGNKKV